MSKGYPSMTALLGLLAVAGYQNRDKISEWLGTPARDAQGVARPGVSCSWVGRSRVGGAAGGSDLPCDRIFAPSNLQRCSAASARPGSAA